MTIKYTIILTYEFVNIKTSFLIDKCRGALQYFYW